MKNKNQLLHRLLFTGLVLCLFFTAYQPVSGQVGNKVFISGIDCSAFPTISLLVRGLDSSGDIISADLLANNFVLYENDQPVGNIKPVGSEEGPKYVVFSFDLGKNSNLDDFALPIRDALFLFANEYFKEERDTVQFALHTNYGTQALDATPPTKNLAEFENAIENLVLSPSSSPLKGYQGLNDLYNQLAGLDPGRSSMVIVHFSRLVEGIPPSKAVAEGADLGVKMDSKNIRVYTFNTDFRGVLDAAPPFQAVATQSGGDYLDFSDEAARQSKLTDIYTQIKLNTQAFRVQFAAGKLNATYSVAPTGVSAADATDRLACPAEIALPAPVVQITQPSGVNPTEFLKADQTTIPVKAALQDWPGDGSRRIARVELLVDGVLATSEDFPPEFTGTAFTLNLDLSQQNIVDSANLKLQVRAIDQFGMAGSAETELTVFAYVPSTQTPGAAIVVPPACQENPFTPDCMLGWVRRNLAWILLVILVIVVIILFITNRKLASMTSPAREAISKGFDQVRKTLLGGTPVRQDALAYLHVLVAKEGGGGKIEIKGNRTSLGRDPKVTDVQLYSQDEPSSVSSLHCTIFYEQNKFYLTDDNSTNGTFVNGQRLAPNEPFELQDGAEIILGDLYRQGAKLRFEIAGMGESQGAYPEMEPDFHVDMPVDGSTYPPAPQEEIDDFRKTVPGYRLDDESANKTDVFREPPVTPPPSSRPAAPPPPSPRPAAPPLPSQPKSPNAGPRDKKDWKDDLG